MESEIRLGGLLSARTGGDEEHIRVLGEYKKKLKIFKKKKKLLGMEAGIC